MIKIELDSQEAQVLKEILERYLSDLRMEIAATEEKEWRDKLKEREDFLKRLISQLG